MEPSERNLPQPQEEVQGSAQNPHQTNDVIHVNLEDEEVKCDDKKDETCVGKKNSVVWDYFDKIKGLPVVKDGLKEQHDSIARIRNATRYVRSSPARLEKFRKCVEREKIKYDKMVCLDVDTRWNSTYTMLEVAVKYEGAFIRMVIEDNDYEDFFKGNDLEVVGESSKKKKKKVVKDAPLHDDFDPRYKMSYIDFCFAKIYGKGSTKNVLMREKVLKSLQELFDYYMNSKGHANSSSTPKINQPNFSWQDDFEKYMEDYDEGGMGKSELDVYLVEARERKGEGFDILTWWKMNSTRFPILSEIAKHVLGMSVSSVASEAAFSTGGRTIDSYRSSLSPKTAEALVCSQDWLRSSERVTDLRAEPEEYLQHEKLENGGQTRINHLKYLRALLHHLKLSRQLHCCYFWTLVTGSVVLHAALQSSSVKNPFKVYV
ncbi:hypothetical protein AgCh_034687 [Apium graveolens]